MSYQTPSVDSLPWQQQQSQNTTTSSSVHDDAPSRVPFCSILNTVVDHVMRDPTPLEPEEYQEIFHRTSAQDNQAPCNQELDKATPGPGNAVESRTTRAPAAQSSSPIKIPVLRIFGPILRRDIYKSVLEPHQSACLHVHGAFPYMLARPTIAGPDGSLHRSIHVRAAAADNDDDDNGIPPPPHVDWDDAAAVARILPVLQDNLEATIQASAQDFAKTSSTRDAAGPPPISPRLIRKMSVVMGRGFYTYCPGPSAPFLKIEYYDPDTRWRIKRALERGLDLPSLYHPDPIQYDALAQANFHKVSRDETVTDALTFHCYEAHVPYTMQFFKDYNLAGMSYLHLENPRFRSPLPRGMRQRWPLTAIDDKSAINMDELLLQWNVPVSRLWAESGNEDALSMHCPSEHIQVMGQQEVWQNSNTEPSASTQSVSGVADDALSKGEEHFSAQIDLFTSFVAPAKESTCDVELDVHVSGILNVLDVMTELPQDETERLSIHWRAVPSLREIWREERRRMARLLPKEHDFLSQQQQRNSSPILTLDVKKNSSLPGTRLAVKGMKKLLQCSDGIEENFRRAMKEIVDRHEHDVQKIDRLLRDRRRLLPTQGSMDESHDQLTPSAQEAAQALEDLGGLFDPLNSCSQAMSQQSKTPSENTREEDIEVLDERTGEQERVPTFTQFTDNSQLSQSSKNTRLSLSQALSQASVAPHGEEQLSQRVDRGDSILDGRFANIENFVDPRTLRPYAEDELDDDDGSDDDDEAAVEAEMSRLATQIADAGNDSHDAKRRKGVVESAYDPFYWNRSSTSLLPEDSTQVSAPDDGAVDQTMSETSSSVFDSWSHRANTAVCLGRSPPNRGQVASGRASGTGQLRPLSSLYQERYTPQAPQSWRLHVAENGADVSLCRAAPSVGEVRRWINAKSKVGKDVTRRDFGETTFKDDVRRSTKDASFGGKNASKTNGVSFSPVAGFSDRLMPVERLTYSAEGGQDMTATPERALKGLGNQGGRLRLSAGGELKAKTRPSPSQRGTGTQKKKLTSSKDTYLAQPVTIMCVEIHVQCRVGRAGVNDSTEIAMTPDPDRDKVFAITYVYAVDPGGGESMRIVTRGCLFVPVEAELRGASDDKDAISSLLERCSSRLHAALPRRCVGREAPVNVCCVRTERQLLLRFASVVFSIDPDILVSWDTQGGGLGYIVERGVALEKSDAIDTASKGLDMARLLSRVKSKNSGTPCEITKADELANATGSRPKWEGSGMGGDWDDRVGAGAAASSISGRLVFAAWKLVAEEVKHPNASYLPAMFATIVGKRIPNHDYLTLTNWYSFAVGRERWRVLHHRLSQACASLLLFDALDIIGRAGEAARLSGVSFHHSFPGIRGSQYKVEGVLLRALKSLNSDERGSKKGRLLDKNSHRVESFSEQSESQTQSPWKARRFGHQEDVVEEALRDPSAPNSYFFYSPSLSDTNRQEALEVQPLTLEPESGHHTDPVVVCDFTALYPSLIIAYNLCYSTCAGRLDYHSTRPEMRRQGVTTGRLGPFRYPESRSATVLKHHMKSLLSNDGEDRLYTSATGTIYVSESVLKGVLPQVLDEMLSTRAMLKRAAKEYKKRVPGLSPSILRQLEARQLALKYVANVTYGYTSATFSGRCAMPLLADTIVECARRTLANAIKLVDQWGLEVNGRWRGCKVLYGDTDSLFVRLPGRSVQEAFYFGEELCKVVTSTNPPPVQLKLEKVYLGSILQTKKKYCGMKMESVDQKKPDFEAKGLETVRRDQCALTQKVLREALIVLFRDGIAAVRTYLKRQWTMILSGAMPVSDFILTGRVRDQYRGGAVGPVQAVLARRLAEVDPGRVVRHSERLAYVIVATPGRAFKLRDCVLTPTELMEQWDAYTIHTTYYITKHLNAALQRCFGLAPHRVDVNAWYEACPKPRRRVHFWPITRSGSNLMISSYFGSDMCSFCGRKSTTGSGTRASVCKICRRDGLKTTQMALDKLVSAQRAAQETAATCAKCNLCFESVETFAAVKTTSRSNGISVFGSQAQRLVKPLANCTCIDCPITFERHRSRELELEAGAICQTLGINWS